MVSPFFVFQSLIDCCRNRPFIERCSPEDPNVSFCVDWIRALAQAMLGFCHFGLPWGFKLTGTSSAKKMSNIRDSGKWGTYALPMPRQRHGLHLQSYTTCFIVLFQFIVAPELKRVLAFGQEGHPWRCTEIANALGYLKITHCPDNTMLDVWYLSVDTQEYLLPRYAAQQQRLQRPLLPIIIFPERAWGEKKKQTAISVRP